MRTTYKEEIMKTVRIVIQRLIALALVMLGVSLVSQSSWAGTQLWDFEKDVKDWKVANGDWKIEGGFYKETSGAVPAMHSLIGEDNWDDYVVEAKIRLDQGNWAGLVFRAQSEFEYYIYYMNVPDNKSELWRHTKPAFDSRANISQIPAVDVKIANNEWLNVKVVAQGKTLQLWINGKLQHEDTDDAYPAGQIGAWVWDTGASFDDVKVSGAGIAGSVTPVQPKGKLATSWGKIKGNY